MIENNEGTKSGSMFLKTYRHEDKYYINYREYVYLTGILGNVLKRDLHTGSDKDYWIRSLYFDSMGNRSVYEKRDGLLIRDKIRLRIYHPDSDTAKLEIKNRQNQMIHKESLLMAREDAKALADGRAEVLKQYSGKVAAKVYSRLTADTYRPKVSVEYEREAFLCPVSRIRVTFDKQVRAGKGLELYQKDVSMIPVFQDPLMVLEVKYDRMVPGWLRSILGSGRSNRSSISKYCLARELLY